MAQCLGLQNETKKFKQETESRGREKAAMSFCSLTTYFTVNSSTIWSHNLGVLSARLSN